MYKYASSALCKIEDNQDDVQGWWWLDDVDRIQDFGDCSMNIHQHFQVSSSSAQLLIHCLYSLNTASLLQLCALLL